MRWKEIIMERAATPRGASKYIGKTGRVYYITHTSEGSVVNCRAMLAGTRPTEPLRTKVANVGVVCEDRDDGKRNNIRVVSWRSFVEPYCRRDGLLNAMYDHLDNHGYVVYPADGSIGQANLQAQSADAKAFWAARKVRTTETKLLPVSEDELHGWGKYNIWANAKQVGDLPVLKSVDKLYGMRSPLLVLWEKQYAKFLAQVGVTFGEHGYRLTLNIDAGEWHDWTGFCFPYRRSENYLELAYYDVQRFGRFLDVAGIRKALLQVDDVLNTL